MQEQGKSFWGKKSRSDLGKPISQIVAASQELLDIYTQSETNGKGASQESHSLETLVVKRLKSVIVGSV